MNSKFLISVFYFIPFIFLLFKFPLRPHLDLSELWWAVLNTATQTVYTTLFAFIFGVINFLGIVGFLEIWPKWRKTITFLYQVISWIPSLIILVVLLSSLPVPHGNLTVGFVQGFLLSGVVAIILLRGFELKLSNLASGNIWFIDSRFQFWEKSFVLLAPEIREAFFLVVSIALTSLSLPLMLGGGNGTNLETLIFEKIHLQGDWSTAVYLGLAQTVVILALSVFKTSPISSTEGQRGSDKYRFGFPQVGIIITSLFSILICKLVFDLFSHWSFIEKVPGLSAALPEFVLKSFFIGLSSGILMILILMMLLMDGPIFNAVKGLNRLIAPSTGLLGLFLFFVGSNEGAWIYIKIWVGFLILFLPSILRLGFETEISSLQRQWQVGQILGAGRNTIVSKVVFPQVIRKVSLLASIFSFWVICDFTLSRIVFSKDESLAMVVDSLMGGYRTGAALACCGLLVLIAALVYFILQGMVYVYDHWFS